MLFELASRAVKGFRQRANLADLNQDRIRDAKVDSLV
jgi:hypothetical protein